LSVWKYARHERLKRHPRIDFNYLAARGDHDGRPFSSDAEAEAFCLERGYTHRYFRVDHAVFRKKWRRPLYAFRRDWLQSIMSATCASDVLCTAESARGVVQRMSGDPLIACTWFLGVMTMARRLRPDLHKETGIRFS